MNSQRCPILFCLTWLCLLFYGTLPSIAVAQMTQKDLTELQERIDDAGLHWQAGENSMTRLSEAERMARVIPINGDDWEESLFPEVTASTTKRPELPTTVFPQPDPTDAVFNWGDVVGEDWTSPVGDQGSCGSCSVFAGIGSIEGVFNVAFGDPDLDLDLAEQHALSCTDVTCEDGGWISLTLDYGLGTGIPDEACYSYTELDGDCAATCPDYLERSFTIVSHGKAAADPTLVPTEEEIKQALMTGPLSTAMTVYDDFYAYNSGIYEVSPDVEVAGGHAVVITGWNDENNSWYAKNSWGTNWGDDGYFEIRRGEAKFGRKSTNWVEVDGNLPIGSYGVDNDYLTTTLELGSGDTASVMVKLQRTAGTLPLSFMFVGLDEVPWLSVDPTEGTLKEDEIELNVTFDESAHEETSPGYLTEKFFIIDGNGLSRKIRARMTLVDPPDTDTGEDTGTGTDTGTDTGTESESDTGQDMTDTDSGDDIEPDTEETPSGANSSDADGCGCSNAGSSSNRTALFALLISLL